MNVSSLAHCLGLDLWYYLKLGRVKTNFKIASIQDFFGANGCISGLALATLSPVFPSSHRPSLHTRRGGGLLMTTLQTSATSTYTHSHHFPRRPHLSFSSSPLAPTWIMLSQSQNEVKKVMARHIVQLRLSANGPSIIKGHTLADATLRLCMCVLKTEWAVDHLFG